MCFRKPALLADRYFLLTIIAHAPVLTEQNHPYLARKFERQCAISYAKLLPAHYFNTHNLMKK